MGPLQKQDFCLGRGYKGAMNQHIYGDLTTKYRDPAWLDNGNWVCLKMGSNIQCLHKKNMNNMSAEKKHGICNLPLPTISPIAPGARGCW
jgi:hypothetical protein